MADNVEQHSIPASRNMAPGKKGKAGGPGKKGKKFVEDKSALLSLIDALPRVQKESAAESATSPAVSSKGKSRSGAGEYEEVAAGPMGTESMNLDESAEEQVTKPKGKARKQKAETKTDSKNRQRTKAKNRALLDTKRAIIAKTKEVKKQRKDAKKPASQKPLNDDAGGPVAKAKRRVGFAL